MSMLNYFIVSFETVVKQKFVNIDQDFFFFTWKHYKQSVLGFFS